MTIEAGGVIFILNLVTEADLGGSREAESTGVRLPEPLVQKSETEMLRHTDAVLHVDFEGERLLIRKEERPLSE